MIFDRGRRERMERKFKTFDELGHESEIKSLLADQKLSN